MADKERQSSARFMTIKSEKLVTKRSSRIAYKKKMRKVKTQKVLTTSKIKLQANDLSINEFEYKRDMGKQDLLDQKT